MSYLISFDEDPIYEDFQPSPSPSVLGSHEIDFGTTFVELIKRPRTKLGVVVTGSVVDLGSDPRSVMVLQFYVSYISSKKTFIQDL